MGDIEILGNSKKRGAVFQKIREFCLLDDSFMSRVFDENIECTELILRIILDRPDIEVCEVHTQREIKNLRGHSVRLDISAKNADGEPIDVEIQRENKGAGVKRARYNSSMMDANTLIEGEAYDRLPESYVIFITEKDVMGADLPVYHAERIVAETGKPLEDGTHIIYVNGAYRDDSPIGKLMHDFSCKDPAEMYFQPLAKQAKYYKENAEGVKIMSEAVEEWVEEWAKEMAKEIGEERMEQEKKEMIVKLKKLGKCSIEEIAEITGFTVEEVEAVDEESLATVY